MANSKRKCKQCKEFKPHEGMVKIMAGWFCNIQHAADWAQVKQKLHRERARKQINRDQKDSLKTQRDYLKTAQVSANAYVRCRDDDKNCISCNRSKEVIEAKYNPYFGFWDAGHYKSRGAKGQLRFNVLNIHKQCKSCNGGSKYPSKLTTVSKDYEANLRIKIGNEYVDYLNNNNESANWTIEYLKRFTKIFNKRKRHLIKLRTMLESTK